MGVIHEGRWTGRIGVALRALQWGSLLLSTLIPAGVAFAEEPADTDRGELSVEELSELPIEDLMDITVTLTTKKPDAIRFAPASISVITARQIEMLNARYLTDVLHLVPGIDVRRYREPLSLIDVRGITSQFNERILIMVDGVSLNDLYTGGSARSVRMLNIENAERIEVIRGPGSALYGTDAFAAVIHVINKQGSPELNAGTRVDYASDNTANVSAYGGGELEGWRYRAFGYYGDSEGEEYDVRNDSLGQSGDTEDPFEEFGGSIKLNYGERVEIALNGGYREDREFITIGDIIGGNDDVNKGAWASASLRYEHPFSDTISLHTQIYGAYNRWGENGVFIWAPGTHPSGSFPDGLYTRPLFDNYRGGADTFVSLELGPHSLIGGFAFELEDSTNSDMVTNGTSEVGGTEIEFYRPKTRTVVAGYLQNEWRITDALRLTGGVRLDHYNDFGLAVNPRAAVVYSPSSRYYVKALYGRAFRAPSYRELYAVNNPVVVGSDDNDAEIIDTVEALFGFAFSESMAGTAGAFYNHIDDVILPTANPVGVATFQNQGTTETYGIELTWNQRFTPWLSAILNFTWTDGETELADGTKVDLALVPRYRANAVLVSEFLERFLVTTTLQYIGERRRDSSTGDPRNDVDDDFVVDLYAEARKIYKGFSLYWKLANVFDADIRTPSNYPTKAAGVLPDDIPGKGRIITMGVKYDF